MPATDIKPTPHAAVFQRAFDSASSGMLIVDDQGQIRYANRQVKTMFGYPPEELVGKALEMLMPERFREGHVAHRLRYWEQAESRPMGTGRDLFGFHRDGREFPIEISLDPVDTEDGRVVLATIVDITERKRSDAVVRQVVEAAPNSMVLVDRDGRITLVNRQAELTFGYSREELLGMSVDQLVPERFRVDHPAKRSQFHADPKRRAMGAGRELFGLRKDGTEFPIEIGLNPVETDDGLCVLSSIVDITERKRSDALVRQVVEAAPNAMVVADPEGRITLVNHQAELTFGYAREELLGMSVDQLVPERFRAGHPAKRAQFHASPERRAMGAGRDLFGLRKDGTEFPVEIGLNPVETDDGLCVLSSIVDITARQRTESLVRQAVEAAPNAMVMVDPSGRITLVNWQAEAMFGYSRHEMLGMSIDRLVPERYRRGHPTKRAVYHKEPSRRAMGAGRDLFAMRKDGTEFPVEIGLNPVETDDGRFVLSAIVDITERKQDEQRLRDYAEELRRRNRELDEFTYVASHDLQEPLRRLISFADLLPRDLGRDLPERAQTDLDYITQAADRMRSLVRDLLSLAHTGNQELKRAPVDLARCVDAARETLGELFDESGTEMTSESLPTLAVDKRLVTQLFQNLLANAIKFSAQKGKPVIHVTAEQDATGWIIGVRDNGIGIPPDGVQAIFKPFKRLHSRGEYAGSGIGLAICRKAVERHGGEIWVESAVNEGAHFRFRLPESALEANAIGDAP